MTRNSLILRGINSTFALLRRARGEYLLGRKILYERSSRERRWKSRRRSRIRLRWTLRNERAPEMYRRACLPCVLLTSLARIGAKERREIAYIPLSRELPFVLLYTYGVVIVAKIDSAIDLAFRGNEKGEKMNGIYRPVPRRSGRGYYRGKRLKESDKMKGRWDPIPRSINRNPLTLPLDLNLVWLLRED